MPNRATSLLSPQHRSANQTVSNPSAHAHSDVPTSLTIQHDPPEHWLDQYSIFPGERHLPHNPQERLHAILAQVAVQSGVPLPRVYENTGILYAAVNGLSGRGLLHANIKDIAELSDDAVRALFAHELGHLKTQDKRLELAITVTHSMAQLAALAAVLHGFGNSAPAGHLAVATGLFVCLVVGGKAFKRSVVRATEYQADNTARQTLGGIQEQVALFVETAQKHNIDLTPKPEKSFIANLFDKDTHPPLGNRLEIALRAGGQSPEKLAEIIEAVKAPAVAPSKKKGRAHVRGSRRR